MNDKFYIQLTRIALAISIGILFLGNLAFVMLRTIIDPMVFSNF